MWQAFTIKKLRGSVCKRGVEAIFCTHFHSTLIGTNVGTKGFVEILGVVLSSDHRSSVTLR